jgi:hypothetical protein
VCGQLDVVVASAEKTSRVREVRIPRAGLKRRHGWLRRAGARGELDLRDIGAPTHVADQRPSLHPDRGSHSGRHATIISMAQFDDLSDYDFELLAADLLGRELGRRFETFSRGPDGGIDLRAHIGRGFHYAQCKHYALSGFARLRSAAEKERKGMQTAPRSMRCSACSPSSRR